MQEVEVNGEFQGLPAYVRGLEAIVAAVPDYRWDPRHLLFDGCGRLAEAEGPTGSTAQ